MSITSNILHLTTDNKLKKVKCQVLSVKCQTGFTLVELITSMAILGIASIMIASIYFAHARLFSNQNTSIDLSTETRLALDEITNQIREGQSVVSTCLLCGGDTTSPAVLVLQLWSLDASGDPIDSTYDYIVYKRDATDNTKLIKKVIPDPGSFRESGEDVVAIHISDLQFTYNNPDPTQSNEIIILLETTDASGTKTFTNTQTSKAMLRNK